MIFHVVFMWAAHGWWRLRMDGGAYAWKVAFCKRQTSSDFIVAAIALVHAEMVASDRVRILPRIDSSAIGGYPRRNGGVKFDRLRMNGGVDPLTHA